MRDACCRVPLPNPESPAFLVSHQNRKKWRKHFEFWGCALDDEDSAASFKLPWVSDSFWISLHKVLAAITQFGEILQIHGLQIFMLFYLFICVFALQSKTTMFDVKHLSVSQREMKHKQTSHSNILGFFLSLCQNPKMIYDTNNSWELPNTSCLSDCAVKALAFVYQTAHADALQHY